MSIQVRLVKMNEVRKTGGYTGYPGDSFVQLVAANGTFLFKDTPFYKATVKLAKVADLGELKEEVELKVPKIGLDTFIRIEDFFQRIYDKHKSEAVVLLYVCLENKTWSAKVPEQEVSGASCDYDMKKMPLSYESDGNKFFLFGSIHSHGSMSAFHSATDDKDEVHFDGLHITIGGFDKVEHSYSVRYMVHGSAFGPVALRDVVDFPELPKTKCEEEWLEKVEEKKSYVKGTQVWNGRDNISMEDWYSQFQTSGKDGRETSAAMGYRGKGYDDRRKPPKSKPQGKLKWKSRASYDHCYTCLGYQEGGKCSVRGRTTPFATCNRYDVNPDIPDRIADEAQTWLHLMEGVPDPINPKTGETLKPSAGVEGSKNTLVKVEEKLDTSLPGELRESFVGKSPPPSPPVQEDESGFVHP